MTFDSLFINILVGQSGMLNCRLAKNIRADEFGELPANEFTTDLIFENNKSWSKQ